MKRHSSHLVLQKKQANATVHNVIFKSICAMRKSFVTIGAFLGLSLLLGAGCSLPGGQPNNTGTAGSEKTTEETTKNDQEETGDEVNPKNVSITLTASDVAKGQATFAWTVSGTGDPERFILVRGPEENPMHDGTHNWFRVFGAKRTATWIDLPSGKHHVRVCLSKNTEACDIYSNDVEIDVPGGETSGKAVDISVSAEGSIKQ